MRGLYSFSMHLFAAGIKLAAPFHAKAKRALQGRRECLKRRPQEDQIHGCIWFHCASLGEFEQARPVIEAWKRQQPEARILLTFFSPSGYDIRKDYSLADVVTYLPIDRPKAIAAFLDHYRPAQAMFVKYEVWPNTFLALEDRGIPLVMFSAIFRPGHRYFKWYGGLFRRSLKTAKRIFVQNEESLSLLKGIGVDQAEQTGDTRFDRVSDVASNVSRIAMVEAFLDQSPTLIAGSSWPQDEQLVKRLLPGMTPEWKIILAPHEIGEEHIKTIRKLFPDAALFSELTLDGAKDSQVLVIDNIGMLNKLYQYGHVSLIGGGFGKGIHNVLEAAVFGMPVLFGPNHQRFDEALGLLKAGGAIALESHTQVNPEVLGIFEDAHRRAEMGRCARDYVRSETGATQRIIESLI